MRSAFPDVDIELIPGGGGDFIVVADGRQLWHKRRMGDAFPEHETILAELRALR